ncbi:MAG: hypothetical protein OXE85_05745 [Roseovarius sp.]|nr:hypothetical protein [Roseovarius sp.]
MSGFAGIFIPVWQKKSLKISVLMEKGMVCEKEKLAGMTGLLIFRVAGNFMAVLCLPETRQYWRVDHATRVHGKTDC